MKKQHDGESVETIRLIRTHKKAGTLNSLPISELVKSQSAHVRKEILRHLDYGDVNTWDLYACDIINNPEMVSEAKTLVNHMPINGSGEKVTSIKNALLRSVLASETPNEEVICYLFENMVMSEYVVIALAGVRHTPEIARSLVKSISANAIALNHQLDSFDSLSINPLTPSLTTIEIALYDDNLSYIAFLALIGYVSGEIQRKNSGEMRFSEGRSDRKFSENVLRAAREGLIRFPPRTAARRESGGTTRWLDFYNDVFSKDEDWEHVLRFGLTQKKIDIVKDLLKCISSPTLTYKGKSENIPLPEITGTAQDVILRCSELDKDFHSVALKAVRARLEIFPASTVHALFHSEHHEIPESLNPSLDYTPTSLFAAAKKCCPEASLECPAWRFIYSWRFHMKEEDLTDFRTIEESLDGKFVPFSASLNSLSRVPTEEIQAFFMYAEGKDNESLLSSETETLMLLHSLLD